MKSFQKKVEDFVCEHCGEAVTGTGYTNHCPKCLWSKHVDIHPGDRAATCGSLMEPIAVQLKNGEKIIHHRCVRCGHHKPNKAATHDNEELIILLSSRPL